MELVTKFCAGVIMTLLFVIGVPFLTQTYIAPAVTDLVGNNTFLILGSEALVQLIMFIVLIGFILVLGGGAILRWCSVVGVLGMVFAYWLLGDVTMAIVPLLCLTVAYIATIPIRERFSKN